MTSSAHFPPDGPPVPWVKRRGIYAIADADASAQADVSVVDVARAMLAGGAVAVQIRAKERGASQVQHWLEEILSATSPPERALLVVNDRADCAELTGISTVHVGQDDLPPSVVKGAYPHLAVGLSTHNRRQLESALASPQLAYVALGPIFPTASKQNPDPVVGVDVLSKCHGRARARGVPLVAIGGVTFPLVADVARHADMIAAIGLLMPAPGAIRPYAWIEARTREMQSLMAGVPLEPLP